MEVTGRGEKSQKPPSLSRGSTASAGSAWDSYLFLPAPEPPYQAEWPKVVIRMGNDQPVRVQSRLGEPRGCDKVNSTSSIYLAPACPPCPYVKDLYSRPRGTFFSWPRNRESRIKGEKNQSGNPPVVCA